MSQHCPGCRCDEYADAAPCPADRQVRPVTALQVYAIVAAIFATGRDETGQVILAAVAIIALVLDAYTASRKDNR